MDSRIPLPSHIQDMDVIPWRLLPTSRSSKRTKPTELGGPVAATLVNTMLGTLRGTLAAAPSASASASAMGVGVRLGTPMGVDTGTAMNMVGGNPLHNSNNTRMYTNSHGNVTMNNHGRNTMHPPTTTGIQPPPPHFHQANANINTNNTNAHGGVSRMNQNQQDQQNQQNQQKLIAMAKNGVPALNTRGQQHNRFGIQNNNSHGLGVTDSASGSAQQQQQQQEPQQSWEKTKSSTVVHHLLRSRITDDFAKDTGNDKDKEPQQQRQGQEQHHMQEQDWEEQLTPIYAKLKVMHRSYTLLLTDLTNVYVEHCTDQQFISTCKQKGIFQIDDQLNVLVKVVHEGGEIVSLVLVPDPSSNTNMNASTVEHGNGTGNGSGNSFHGSQEMVVAIAKGNMDAWEFKVRKLDSVMAQAILKDTIMLPLLSMCSMLARIVEAHGSMMGMGSMVHEGGGGMGISEAQVQRKESFAPRRNASGAGRSSPTTRAGNSENNNKSNNHDDDNDENEDANDGREGRASQNDFLYNNELVTKLRLIHPDLHKDLRNNHGFGLVSDLEQTMYKMYFAPLPFETGNRENRGSISKSETLMRVDSSIAATVQHMQEDPPSPAVRDDYHSQDSMRAFTATSTLPTVTKMKSIQTATTVSQASNTQKETENTRPRGGGGGGGNISTTIGAAGGSGVDLTAQSYPPVGTGTSQASLNSVRSQKPQKRKRV